jgi:single-strand DNA-binding protein
MANRGYNKVVLVGNLGQDPDMRTTPAGHRVCSISIATSDNYKDQAGNWVERTDWHRISLWGNLADTASKYLKKGDKVLIEGSIHPRDYEKDGVKHYTYEIRAFNMLMLTPKGTQENFNQPSPDEVLNEDFDAGEGEEDEDLPF